MAASRVFDSKSVTQTGCRGPARRHGTGYPWRSIDATRNPIDVNGASLEIDRGTGWDGMGDGDRSGDGVGSTWDGGRGTGDGSEDYRIENKKRDTTTMYINILFIMFFSDFR